MAVCVNGGVKMLAPGLAVALLVPAGWAVVVVAFFAVGCAASIALYEWAPGQPNPLNQLTDSTGRTA